METLSCGGHFVSVWKRASMLAPPSADPDLEPEECWRSRDGLSKFIGSAHARPRRVPADSLFVCVSTLVFTPPVLRLRVSAFKGSLENASGSKRNVPSFFFRLDQNGGGEGRVAPHPLLLVPTIIFTFLDKKKHL